MVQCNNSNQASSGNDIYITSYGTRTSIDVENNKARYFAELAEIYKNAAKDYRDSAQYYFENADVTKAYVDDSDSTLRDLIDGKQDSGNYALVSNVPTKTSDLINDSDFITTNALSGLADINLSNIPIGGISRLHTLKSYKDAGELLTDAEGLADVTAYAHSTFDSTKFTVVGSPTISADDILNATTNNYPKSPTINFSTASSWKIKTKFKTPTTAVEQSLYSGLTNPIITVVYGTTKKFRFAVGDGSSWFLTNIESTHTFSLDTEYEVSLEFNGTNYTLYVDGIQEATSASSSKIANAPLLFGVDRSGYSVLSPDGSIDLKTVNVVLDGISVFSGNKTGIDAVKPDNYTITGTPTISDDGIASSFSNSNYLSNATVIDTTKPWSAKLKFTTATLGTAQGIFTLSQYFYLIFSSDKTLQLRTTNNTQTNWVSSVNTLADNTEYDVECGWNGTKLFLNYKTASGTWVHREVTPSAYSGVASSSITHIGNWNGSYAFAGSIDLNAFKVYVDGNLVYQPCLKIPYTLSKTGSKIVDSVYRDRVSDMYNQFGYAPYYTLLEGANFTLPQGELYGLLSDNAWVYADQTTPMSEATAIGTYDLKETLYSLLPDKNSIYECLFRYVITRAGDSGTTNSYYGFLVNNNIVARETIDARGGTSALETNGQSGQFTGIISPNDTVELYISNQALYASGFYLVAYRKIKF